MTTPEMQKIIRAPEDHNEHLTSYNDRFFVAMAYIAESILKRISSGTFDIHEDDIASFLSSAHIISQIRDKDSAAHAVLVLVERAIGGSIDNSSWKTIIGLLKETLAYLHKLELEQGEVNSRIDELVDKLKAIATEFYDSNTNHLSRQIDILEIVLLVNRDISDLTWQDHDINREAMTSWWVMPVNYRLQHRYDKILGRSGEEVYSKLELASNILDFFLHTDPAHSVTVREELFESVMIVFASLIESNKPEEVDNYIDRFRNAHTMKLVSVLAAASVSMEAGSLLLAEKYLGTAINFLNEYFPLDSIGINCFDQAMSRVISSFVSHPNFIEYAKEIIRVSSGPSDYKWFHSRRVHYIAYISRMSSTAQTADFDEKHDINRNELHQLSSELSDQVLNDISEMIHSESYDIHSIRRILSSFTLIRSKENEGQIVSLLNKLLASIVRRRDSKDRAFYELSDRLIEIIIRNLIEFGEYYKAWDSVITYLPAEKHYSYAFDIGARASSFVSAEEINSFRLEDLSEMNVLIPYQWKICVSIGRFSEIEMREVVHSSLSANIKIALLVGMGLSGDSKAVSRASEMVANEETPVEIFELYLDEIKRALNYQMITTLLFRLLNHKKENDYRFVIPDYKHAASVIIELVRIGNAKAKGIAVGLISNEQFLLENPYDCRRLVNVLFEYEFFPQGLHKVLLHRSENNGDIDDRYLRLIAQLYRESQTVLSLEFLELVEPYRGTRKTYEEMMLEVERINRLLEESDGGVVTKPISPIAFCRILANREALESLVEFLHLSKDRFGYISHYPFETFKLLLNKVKNIEINQMAIDTYGVYLAQMGVDEAKAQRMINNVLNGLHPESDFDEHNNRRLKRRVDNAKGSDDIDLQRMVLTRIVRSIVDRLPDKEKILKQILNESIESKDGLLSVELFIKAVERAGIYLSLNTSDKSLIEKLKCYSILNISDDELEIIESAITSIEILERQRKLSGGSSNEIWVEYVEKGINPLLFARGADAVRECVNSDKVVAHLKYMPRRMADPFSFTLVVRGANDLIIGTVEARTFLNSNTGMYEIGAMIYSANKTGPVINEIIRMIEFTIARPLKMGAINISNVYGGVIPSIDGFQMVSKNDQVTLAPFSPVQSIGGNPVVALGDDIIRDRYQWGKSKTGVGIESNFIGWRKEL